MPGKRATSPDPGERELLPVAVRLGMNAGLFPLLGVRAAHGRTFTADEDHPDPDTVLLGDRLWRRRFAADKSVVGRAVTLNGSRYNVVGIMPPGFYVVDPTVELWLPIGFRGEARTPRGRWLTVLGRLKPGVTFEQAQRDMSRVAGDLTRMFPEFNTGWTANVVPLETQMTGAVRPALLMLLGAVGFVLLIACANVANLLLARATVRHRELAIRSALGADRCRLARQLLVESLVLAAIGGLAGTALARGALRGLQLAVEGNVSLPRMESVSLDTTTWMFTLAASLGAGLVFGIVPALSAVRGDASETLKEGGRTGTAWRGDRARSAFVVVEVALALVLLAGAALLIRSFARLLSVAPGFQAAGVMTMKVSLPGARYPDEDKQVRFFEELFERIDTLPGVRASGGVTWLPLDGLGAATAFEAVGRPKPPLGQEPVCDVRVITHDFFNAMGIPLLHGRGFTGRETSRTSNVVVVSESLAKEIWPGEDPIGKQIVVQWRDSRPDEVVGVVGDVRHAGLDTGPRPTIYWPHVRSVFPWMMIAVRTSDRPTSLVPAITAEVRRRDPELPVADIRTMEEIVSTSVAPRRLTTLLLGLFSVLALALAAVGIYGVIGYMVVQRAQEIGIRMALGAARGDVLRLVVGHAMWLAMLGIVLGAAGAVAMSRLIEGLLFDVEPGDPVTLMAVSVTVALVALVASGVPALRATRIDPMIALRAE